MNEVQGHRGPDSSPLIVACQAPRRTEINMLGPPVTQCCKRCDRRIPACPGVHRSACMRYDDIVTLPVSWRSRKFTLSIVDDVSGLDQAGPAGLKDIFVLLFGCARQYCTMILREPVHATRIQPRAQMILPHTCTYTRAIRYVKWVVILRNSFDFYF